MRPAGYALRRTTAWPCPVTSPASCRKGCRNCSATTSTRRSWGTSTAATRAGCFRRIPSRSEEGWRPGEGRLGERLDLGHGGSHTVVEPAGQLERVDVVGRMDE